MTMKEIVECVKRIRKRRESLMIFEAKIHGAYNEEAAKKEEKVKFNEQDDKTSEKAMNEAMENLKKRRESRNGNRK